MGRCRPFLAALLYGALIAPAGISASPEPSTPSLLASETQALVQRLVLERAAAVASVQRLADDREEQLFAELAAKDRRLRAEQAARRAAQTDLAEVTRALAEVAQARLRLVDSLTARDRQFAAEIGEYRQQVAAIAGSPDPRKRAALERYADGDRAGGFDALVAIQEAEAKAVAAGWREIGALALDRKDRGEMQTGQVIPIYERAQQMDPENARGWVELRRLYQEAGRLADAKRAAEQALAQAKGEWERSVAEVELGEVLVSLGDLAGARPLFLSSLQRAEALAAANPSSAEAQRDVGVSLDRLGDLLAASGDWDGARERYGASLQLRERLARAEPASPRAQRDYSISLGRLGDLLLSAGVPDRAKMLFENGLRIAERLAAENETSVRAQRDLTANLDRLGSALLDLGDLAGARARFEASLKILERLRDRDPSSAEIRRDLAVELGRVSEILSKLGDRAGARVRAEESLRLKEAEAASNPGSADAQRDLSLGLNRLGDLLFASGDVEGARVRFEASLRLREGLAAANPASADAQRDLMTSHARLAQLPVGGGHWAEALRIGLALQTQGRLVPGEEGLIDVLRQKVAEADAATPKNRP